MTRRPATRWVKRGSSIGAVRAANVSSPRRPQSLSATVRRSVRSGSTTSTVIGPTVVSVRSVGARRDARTTHCFPPRTTLNAASMTRRFG